MIQQSVAKVKYYSILQQSTGKYSNLFNNYYYCENVKIKLEVLKYYISFHVQ